jgi:hypothetical protein
MVQFQPKTTMSFDLTKMADRQAAADLFLGMSAEKHPGLGAYRESVPLGQSKLPHSVGATAHNNFDYTQIFDGARISAEMEKAFAHTVNAEIKRRRLVRLEQAWDILCSPWTILGGLIALGITVLAATVSIHNHLN